MNRAYFWYARLLKPSWPPPWLFGPVWTVLYGVIAASFGTVFYKAFTREIPWVIAIPFALNLLFNFIFSPIQFGLRNNELASIDILLVVATLAWALYGMYPYLPWVTYANIPYLLWGSFATCLQLTITYLNSGRSF